MAKSSPITCHGASCPLFPPSPRLTRRSPRRVNRQTGTRRRRAPELAVRAEQSARLGERVSGVVGSVEQQQRWWAKCPTDAAPSVTDADGRCSTLLDGTTKLNPGLYRMTFLTQEYFIARGVETFYPVVEVG